MGSCCSAPNKKNNVDSNIPPKNEVPQRKGSETMKIQIEILKEKDTPACQRGKVATEQIQSIESLEHSKRPEGLMTSPISARKPPGTVKKTTDISHALLEKNEQAAVQAINPYAVLRAKRKNRRAHESLAAGIEDSEVLQASINSQRKNSVSLARRKLSQKIGFPDHVFTSPPAPAEEEEKAIIGGNVETAENCQEKAMLLRYVFAWTDLATAYQQEGYFVESLDCIESAAIIYERLLMYPHLSLCLGQFFLAMCVQGTDVMDRDIFIEPEKDTPIENDYYPPSHKKMRQIGETLKEINVGELRDFYEFYIAALLITRTHYNKARELLENCTTDLEELMFLKAFVYGKLQILTSQKICFDMLNPDYQRKYRVLVSKDCSNPVIKEECERIKDVHGAETADLLDCKKSVWKEILLKAEDTLKRVLCGYVAGNTEIYIECDSFKELVLGQKSLEDCLLILGHIVRVWLLMPSHAVAFYEQATALNPSNATPYFFLGVTYRGKGELEKAVEMYQKALVIKPAYPDCLFNLGNIYFEHHQNLTKAEELYRTAFDALKNEEESVENAQKSIINKGRICNLLGEVYKQNKDTKKAIKQYMCGIKEDSAFIDNYADLAEILRNQKNEELAIIVEYMGKIITNEENKTSYEEKTVISQCVKILELNLRRGIYDDDIKGPMLKIYEAIDYLLLNVLLSEYQMNSLKHLLFQLSFVRDQPE